jgi:hypothetical protein
MGRVSKEEPAGLTLYHDHYQNHMIIIEAQGKLMRYLLLTFHNQKKLPNQS